MPYRTSEIVYEDASLPRSTRSSMAAGPAPATRSSYYSTRRSSEGSRHPYRFDEDDYYYRQQPSSSRTSTMTLVKPHLERGGTALPRILLLLWAFFMTLAWVSEETAQPAAQPSVQPTHLDRSRLSRWLIRAVCCLLLLFL